MDAELVRISALDAAAHQGRMFRFARAQSFKTMGVVASANVARNMLAINDELRPALYADANQFPRRFGEDHPRDLVIAVVIGIENA
jgi:hypothetical protein